MYRSDISSTEKCLAYAIFDHLNSVTLDAWPAQETLAQRLGFKAIKTIRRGACALEEVGLITVKYAGGGKARCRYAPIFSVEDFDIVVPAAGHMGPISMDNPVGESSLSIHIKPTSTEAAASESKNFGWPKTAFSPRERGLIEVELAKLLGTGGWQVLHGLSSVDDAAVERLCCAFAEGFLSEKDLAAARLAAAQA
jgi:hypothetical protein